MLQLGKVGRKIVPIASLCGLSSLGLTLGACSGEGPADGAAAGGDCADFERTEPLALDANVDVIATGQASIQSLTQLTPALIADDSGLYWYDANGSVFSKPHGQASVVPLFEGTSLDAGARLPRIVGMVASSDRLFVGDGHVAANAIDFSGLGDIHAPSRLLSIPKPGGPASVLLESDDQLLVPIAADATRLIVYGGGAYAQQFYQVNLASPALEPLPVRAPLFTSNLSDGLLYWSANLQLWRSGFDDLEPERLTRVPSDDLTVGPDYFLSRHTFSAGESVIQTLYVQQAGSSCSRAVPRLAQLALGETARDAAYFYYYNSRPYDWTLPDGRVVERELIRVDVQTGAQARVSTPSITPQSNLGIVGHDAQNIYVTNGDALIAIEKP